jgi:hypothetical protein
MDEGEAARNGGFPTRNFLGTDFEMAGTSFRGGWNDLPSGGRFRTFFLPSVSETSSMDR